MRSNPPARRGRAIRHPGRAVAVLTVLVLSANLAVLGTGWVPRGTPGVAAAAAATPAPSSHARTEPDPVTGLVVQIPLLPPSDPTAALPVPENAPANPRAPTPDVRHGLLEIPKIGLSQTLFEGVTLTAIDRGPSHWPGTALPGQVGNVVVAGHRTTHTRPFYRLNELVPGDELIFTVDGVRYVYVLDRLEIVSPTDVHIVDQTRQRTATLFGCHPRGSARQRIVAHFRMKPATVSVVLPDVGGSARALLGS